MAKRKEKNFYWTLDPLGGVSPIRLYLYFFNVLPHQFDVIKTDGLELYKILRKKHSKKIMYEKEFIVHDLKNKENPEMHFLNCVYSTKEMISCSNESITYLFDKESIFTKEEILKLAKANLYEKSKMSKIGFGSGEMPEIINLENEKS
jgi:hypothetical protein